MNWLPKDILKVLDQCCEDFTFPMLDNGYFYLAATRLSLHRSVVDWAMVIETFGFSPRDGVPSTGIYTFASRLKGATLESNYASLTAQEKGHAIHRHNELEFIYPVADGDWQDPESQELLADGIHTVIVRDEPISTPPAAVYSSYGIVLEQPPQVQTFELCRALAALVRGEVLATVEERRRDVLPSLQKILVLDEWNHPNVLEGELPSCIETFKQLAEVLASGDVSLYQPTEPPNTHWSNWLEGGTL